ncbi:hypothetical protein [Alteromonas halophila]|uniref:Uncharacterized protein n=1 Tax=Alteromonas halophila TaxID=516698 RepID=A0A918JJY5_9ALTE|nr:hypothetical protein [Alteromonas halophila]GGW83873.1 hypothetical protein GCM10007391_16850 [Alteromonas halophila]
MKPKFLAVFVALMTGSVSAYDGFSPSEAGCKGVAKEIKRVTREKAATSSRIQGEWLDKQLQALNSKKSSCETKGFSTN